MAYVSNRKSMYVVEKSSAKALRAANGGAFGRMVGTDKHRELAYGTKGGKYANNFHDDERGKYYVVVSSVPPVPERKPAWMTN